MSTPHYMPPHLADLLVDELAAREWTEEDAARRMRGDQGVKLLALHMFMAVRSKDMILAEQGNDLALAFGVPREFFDAIHTRWVEWAKTHDADYTEYMLAREAELVVAQVSADEWLVLRAEHRPLRQDHTDLVERAARLTQQWHDAATHDGSLDVEAELREQIATLTQERDALWPHPYWKELAEHFTARCAAQGTLIAHLTAQLAASVTLEEHTRIVADTITALRARAVALEEM